MFDPKSPPQNLAEMRALLDALPDGDPATAAQAAEREPQLTKPAGALGRLEALSAWLATWQGRHPPQIRRPRVVVFAGSHGVCEEGVSAFPSEVNGQMVQNFLNGGAAINQICSAMDAELRVMEVALEIPTANFTKAPAMDEEDCAEAMSFGMSAVEPGLDLICVGEMGIGNTTAAAAICHGLYGEAAELWTGPGTGVEGAALARKIRVVGDAVMLHKHLFHDGLDVLRCLGGREIAAIAGAMIAARYLRVPVVIDGYVAGAAAAVLEATRPGSLDHCIVAHNSAEPGHTALLTRLNKTPLIDFGMRLGEASGAALVIGMLRAAAECHAGMATFAEAAVAGKSG